MERLFAMAPCRPRGIGFETRSALASLFRSLL
jgi:hypothetical protein